MERTSNQTPVVIGVVALILIAVFTYFLVRDSNGERTTILENDSQEEISEQQNDSPRVYTGFTISDEQNEALVSAGVDPMSIPDRVSGDQEKCFVDILGEERVAEIKGGAIPNAIEFARAKSCIE